MQPDDVRYMRMALALAKRGIGLVEPNPAVGCVIVRSGEILGRGWHKGFGKAHAEVDAIQDCRNRGNDPAGATMYVTLEPCCHYGKTGPCTEAIIDARIGRVVVATPDPSAQINGKGISILRQAGIAVDLGTCQQEARFLNGPFFKFVQTGRPWVIAKWAQSVDGMLAYTEPAKRYLTSPAARRHAHILRRRTQAIIVGINTILQDDPLLTPRPGKGRSPMRVVMDRELRTPLGARILAQIGTYPVLICTTASAMERKQQQAERLRGMGVELLAGPAGQEDLGFILQELASRGVQQVLVEGGAALLASVLDMGLADEIHVYIAPMLLGSAGKARISLERAGQIAIYKSRVRQIGPDAWLWGLTESGYGLCVDIPKAQT